MDQTCSGDDRNYLAVEWVTPEGEMLRLGSLGSSDEWFSGDGPGNIVEGHDKRDGAPGRFTGRVHPSGPEGLSVAGTHRDSLSLVGISPDYNLSEIPPNMLARYYSFPSAEKMYQAELENR